MDLPGVSLSSGKPSTGQVSHSHPHCRTGLTLHLGTPRLSILVLRPQGQIQGQNCPVCKPPTYLLVDLTHGEVLVITGARHADVLEPAAGPRLTSIHTELLVAQVFGDLPRKKENQDGQRRPPCEKPAICVAGSSAPGRQLTLRSSARTLAQLACPGASGSPVQGEGALSFLTQQIAGPE